MSDEIQDRYKLEYFKTQSIAQDHRCNQMQCDILAMAAQIKKLFQRIDDLERHRTADMAEIGGIKSRLDAAAQVVARMKKEPK